MSEIPDLPRLSELNITLSREQKHCFISTLAQFTCPQLTSMLDTLYGDFLAAIEHDDRILPDALAYWLSYNLNYVMLKPEMRRAVRCLFGEEHSFCWECKNLFPAEDFDSSDPDHCARCADSQYRIWNRRGR